MDHFNYRNGQYFAEEVPLADIAQIYGTPTYVYSRATLERHWFAFDNALSQHPHLICYAVKANSNLAVLNILAQLGSGFDIVSVGELERVIAAKGDPAKCVFSGVGKQAFEIKRALEVGIYCFNVESRSELILINEIAESLNKKAPISFRVNPDVDAGTHPYIATGLKENKFGIAIDEAESLYLKARDLPAIQIKGVDCHIGSQLTELSPFLEALDKLLILCDKLEARGIKIEHLDLGGGLGVKYLDENPPLPDEQAAAFAEKVNGRNLKIILEPGRAIAANAGILLTKVELIKSNSYKNFAIVDAAMNDLIRPSLYQAWQDIVAVAPREGESKPYDIVGPVCETGDFLGKNREFVLEKNDLLAVRTAGAYGFVMSSNYNTRPRAAEVLVDGKNHYLVREREKVSELFEKEFII